MYSNVLGKFFVLLFILLALEVGAVDIVNVNNNTGEVSLSPHSEVFIDQQNYFTYEDVSKDTFSENFTPVNTKSISPGHPDDIVWMRFNIKNSGDKLFSGELEIPLWSTNTLDVYIKSEETFSVKKLDSNLTSNEREIDLKSFFVPLVMKPLASAMIYIRAEGADAITITPYLYGEKKSFERLRYFATFNGVLIGMILIMLVYHLNRYVILEDRNYLYYSLYLTTLLLLVGIFYGYNLQLFWRNSPIFNDWISPVIVAFSFFTGLLFSRNFLKSSNNFPQSDRYLSILMYSFVLLGIFTLLIDSNILIMYLTLFFAILYSVGLIYLSIASMQKEISGSGYILSAWSLFALLLILSLIMMLGFIDYSSFIYDIYGYVIIFNILFLSFALVQRSNDMRILSESIIEKEHDSLYKITKSKVELQNLNEKLEQKIDKQSKKISNIDKEREQFSIKDKLTNLYNREKLEELLANELHRSKRYLDDFSLIIINIDGLGYINDTQSFQVGDSVIKEMADILIKNIRYIDTVGRWSESEYLIICPETNAEKAKIASQHIQKAIESYKFFFVGNVTVSFGVTACLPTDSGQDIIARAYAALAKSKENGKNRVEVI